MRKSSLFRQGTAGLQVVAILLSLLSFHPIAVDAAKSQAFASFEICLAHAASPAGDASDSSQPLTERHELCCLAGLCASALTAPGGWFATAYFSPLSALSVPHPAGIWVDKSTIRNVNGARAPPRFS